MTPRMLDTGKEGSSSESKKHRLIVDKWVGSFAGRARAKLQLAIDRYLKALEEALAAAEKPTSQIGEHLRQSLDGVTESDASPAAPSAAATKSETQAPWTGTEDALAMGGREHLTKADRVITKLKTKSHNTPYAFIGLQLHEIGLSHVRPAYEHLGEAMLWPDRPGQQLNEVDQASYHIAQARAKLKDLTARYDAVKRKLKIADEMKRVAEMHRIFVEDMQKLLKSSKPKLNPPRPGEMIEMKYSEEYKKALAEYYERLKELMDELGRILAEDPDLLRRFMAAQRMDCMTVRDQLTVLSRRQTAVHRPLAAWLKASETDRSKVLDEMTAALENGLDGFANDAAELDDNITIWMPRHLDSSSGPLAAMKRRAGALALEFRRLSGAAAVGGIDATAQSVLRLSDELDLFADLVADTTAEDDPRAKLAIYGANRLAEIEAFRLRLAGWLGKREQLGGRRFGPALAIDQDILLLDTEQFGEKLSRVAGMVASMSPEIKETASRLHDTVSNGVVGAQANAMFALQADQLMRANDNQLSAMDGFARAEDLFDELLTLMEKKIAEMKRGKEADGLPPEKTLEDLLAMLENECKACEKLGLALMTNLMLQGDWMDPNAQGEAGMGGAGIGSGSPSSGQSGPPQRGQRSRPNGRLQQAQARAARDHARQAAREMERTSEQARADARDMAANPPNDPSIGPPRARNTGSGGSDTLGVFQRGGRDWNIFVSQLRDDIRMGYENVLPDEYREAIDSYLRRLADLAANQPADTDSP